jgi:cyclic pyranopterin phosphate synthase
MFCLKLTVFFILKFYGHPKPRGLIIFTAVTRETTQEPLIDSFGRKHDYLRISLTPHCNLRCFYCMPNEDYDAPPAKSLMQTGEILNITDTFIRLGVKKIRLTGGEPFVRNDAGLIIEKIAETGVKLAITTNGTRIHEFIGSLQAAGIHSLNVSLDTLDAKKFAAITRRDMFNRVWTNIELLLHCNMHVKLNVVVMKGTNDSEINDFIALTKDLPMHVRFIEFMPFDKNNWNNDQLFGWQQILHTAAGQNDFYPLQPKENDTAKSYQVYNHTGTFAVISTMTAPFCDTCNRIRLTADGKMKNCLFSTNEADLLTPLRNGEDIEPIIRQCILNKAKATGGQFDAVPEKIDPQQLHNRSMIAIGG